MNTSLKQRLENTSANTIIVYEIISECASGNDCTVKQCDTCGQQRKFIDDDIMTKSEILNNISRFGQTLFLTYEEALTKLKEII